MLIDGYQNTTISVIKKTPLFSPLNSSLDFLGTATFCYTIHYCVLAIGAEGLKCIKKENIIYDTNIRMLKNNTKSNLYNIINYSSLSFLSLYKSVGNVDDIADVNNNVNMMHNIINNNNDIKNNNNHGKRYDIETNNNIKKDDDSNDEINFYEVDSSCSIEMNCVKCPLESNNKRKETLKLQNLDINSSVKNKIGKKKIKNLEIIEESRESSSEHCIQIISNDNNDNHKNNCSNNRVQNNDEDYTIDEILINDFNNDNSNNIINHNNKIDNTERQIFNVITDISIPLRMSFGLTCFLNIFMGGAGFAFYRLSAIVM